VKTHPFLVEAADTDFELSREHVDHRWIEAKELSELETFPGNRKALEILGVK